MTDLQVAVKEIVESNGGPAFAKVVLRYGCRSGCVPGLLYVRDTHRWFDIHYEDIMELKERYKNLKCKKIRYDGDIKHWYAWFSFEQTVMELYVYK